MSTSSRKDPYAALRNREFVFFLTMRFFLTLAIQMQSVIVGWQIYEYTKDELSLGMIGLAEAIPFIVTSLFSGHVADVTSRKKIIVASSSLLLVATAVLLWFSIDNKTFLGTYGVMPIYLVVGLIGIIRGFFAAATMPFMSQLLPRDLYANAATWNSSVWHTGAVVGPAVAGLICALSFSAAYVLSLIFIAIAIVAVAFIAAKPVPRKEKKETLKQSLSAGIKFVFSNQLLLSAISLDLFAVLFGGAVAMLPAYADKILFSGPIELGFLRSAPAVGAIFTAMILAYKPPGKNAGKELLINVGLFGVAIVLFAVSTNFYLSFFALFLTGAFDNVSVVIRHTIMQLSTPDNMRGRVSAINSIFIGSSNEIGAFESGITAYYMGLMPSVVFGGAMTIAIVLATAKLAPKLRRLDLSSIE